VKERRLGRYIGKLPYVIAILVYPVIYFFLLIFQNLIFVDEKSIFLFISEMNKRQQDLHVMLMEWIDDEYQKIYVVS
jgi:hypothetical protein